MTSVASRVFRSTPHRDTIETWEAIVEMLTRGEDSPAKAELLSVTGIASCIIAEHAPADSAIVVTADGPRTRLYCLYDEDAIDGSGAKEDALGYDPLAGNWAVSLPCPKDDLEWVTRALHGKSKRISARDMSSTIEVPENAASKAQPFNLDVEAFLKS